MSSIKSNLHFWQADTQRSLLRSYISINDLPQEKIEQFEKITNIKRKNELLITYFYLNFLCQLYTEGPSKSRIIFSSLGKPYIDQSKLKFSLAHSNGKIVYVFGKGENIGIDIENTNKSIDKKRILEKISHPKDSREEKDFFKLWTAKEAIVKLTGLGLTTPLSDILIDGNIGYKGEQKFYLSFFEHQEYQICIAQLENKTISHQGSLL